MKAINKMKAFVLGAAAILMALTSSTAKATIYEFNWPPQNGGSLSVDNTGGVIENVKSSYNTSNKEFSYYATFGAVPGSSTLKTNGFWLAVSSGPNPKGTDDQLAIFYFDASRSTPVLTVYGYNGVNGNTSWYDGSDASGTQSPDRIKSSKVSTDWIKNLTATTVAGKTVLGFKIDASGINSHDPKYGAPADWEGAKFGSKIGIWFHQQAGVSSSYGSNGFLSAFNSKKGGWFDGANLNTNVVPEPASMTALALGALALIRRKK